MKNQNNQNNNQPIGTYDPSQPIGYYYPTKQKKKHHVWLWVVVGIVVLSGIFGNAGKKSSKEDADQTKITDSDTTEMQIYEVEPKEDDLTTSDNAVPVPDTVENTTETPQTDNTDPVVTAENSEEQTGAEPDTKAPNSVEEEITNEPEIQTLLNTDTSPVLTTEHSEITEKQEEANTPEPAIQSLEDTGTDQTDISVTRETPVSAGGTSDPYWLQYTYEKERIITDSVLHVYAVNKNTHKIHETDCYQVKKILPENYDETTDPDSLIAEGYEWCKICH